MLPIQVTYGPRTEAGQLRSVVDFDLPYALHGLVSERRDGQCTTWRTAPWINFFTAGVAAAIGFGLWSAARFDPVARQSSLVAKLALIATGACFFGAMLLLGSMALARGRLVLDCDARELRFYRFWFSIRPHRRLPLDEIAALSQRDVVSPGDQDGSGHTYRILVAELHDGRTASIAVDSVHTIEAELGQARFGVAPDPPN